MDAIRLATWSLLLLVSSKLATQAAGGIIRPPETVARPPSSIAEPATDEVFDFDLGRGLPMDFHLFARAKYPELFARNSEEAIARSRDDLEKVGGDTGAEEAIIQLDPLKRPLLYAATNDVHPQEHVPDRWFDDVNNSRARIRRSIRSVGRIEVTNYPDPNDSLPPYGLGWVAGTGFVVAPHIVMTNRHVVAQFAKPATHGDGRTWTFKENPPEAWDIGPATVWFNLSGTFDGQMAPRLRIEEVLYVVPEDAGTDVALLRVSDPEGSESPPPIPLQVVPPPSEEIKRKVAVCGYPADPGRVDRAPFSRRLGAYKAKRISLGEILHLSQAAPIGPPRPTIYHDCSTLSGSSGSPLVDLATGKVWAVHYRGREGVANYAEPMWAILQDAHIRRYLKIASPPPPAEESPSITIPRPADFVRIQNPGMGFLDGRNPTNPMPDFMGNDIRRYEEVLKVIPSVGELSNGRAAQTCFLVAHDVVMTYVSTDSLLEGFTRDQLVVDFDRTMQRAPYFSAGTGSASFRVIEILYPSGPIDPGKSTVALLRLEPRAREYPARRLWLGSGDPGLGVEELVFTIGHPSLNAMPSRNSEQLEPRGMYEFVFPPPYGVKRVSWGKLMPVAELRNDQDRILNLYHDCSTAAGSLGGPLIRWSSGEVIGIHMGGKPPEFNYAISAWEFFQDPEFTRILNRAIEAH